MSRKSRVRRFSSLAALSVLLGLSPVVQAQLPENTDNSVGHVGVYWTQAKTSSQWIGVACEPVPDLLRAHIDVPAGQGLLVRQVASGSPAEKAGLAPYDVLLQASGKPLESPAMLVQAVANVGDEGLQLTWLHRGDTRTSELKPVSRPERAGGADWESMPRDVLRRRFNFTAPLQMRLFGRPALVPLHADRDVPEDLKIQIRKHGSKPARILVEKGGQKWDITEDQLDKLPKDVRPFVERFTKKGVIAGLPELGGTMFLPEIEVEGMPQEPSAEFFSRPEARRFFRKFAPFDIEKRLNRIDRRMEQLRDEVRQLRGVGAGSKDADAKAGGGKPDDDRSEAPKSQDARPDESRSDSSV